MKGFFLFKISSIIDNIHVLIIIVVILIIIVFLATFLNSLKDINLSIEDLRKECKENE